ncbi:MAG: acetoacetate--CoA ligase [Alphaproteobacteria bacterium]
MAPTAMSQRLWTPDARRIAEAQMTAFRTVAAATAGRDLPDYAALHRWTVADPGAFWRLWWERAGVVGNGPGGVSLRDGERMPGAAFFPEAQVNFAENLLRRDDDGDAIVFWGEDMVRRNLSWRGLNAEVAALAAALRADGVVAGDRVAGYLPNMSETVVAMLAAASIGAIWSSCSPDFGPAGVIDRFGQIAPKVLIAADGYWYGGKRFDCLAKVRQITPSLKGLRRVVVVGYAGSDTEADGAANAVWWDDYLDAHAGADHAFVRLPFNAPQFILYSSGTTGVPKCIVHGVGGTLLQHLKEHRLHSDIRAGDRVFYFTTCGWMMWNWLVSALARQATLLLYDGSPFHPDGNVLFDFATIERATFFGTSAKYIDAVAKAGLAPARTHDLGALRTVASTGSPLSPDGFAFVYEAIKDDVHLASISGGTDIVSCFMLGDPTQPVRAGELQVPGLGMAVEVWNDDGRPVRGEKGELVCTRPFPSMPVGFWNDADGSRYRAAYFERFSGIWTHGDYVEHTAAGGYVIHGRSDATLNPGGVRIGTAEIYRQVEKLDDIVESLVIGQDWQGDVRVVLFVRLRDGAQLDDDLTGRIKGLIRSNCTPRHVPAKIVAVADIPRTRSGKIVELAVREAVHGRPIRNAEALANPEALDLFRNLPQLGAP